MTQLSSADLKTQTATLFADNTTGDISAGDMRTQMDNIADSAAFKTTGRIIDPGVTDDGVGTSGNGIFAVGDIWINETADNAWINADVSTSAAVWLELSFTDLGTITGSGAPVNNELAVWTSATNVEGDPNLTWDGTSFGVTGNVIVSGTVDGRDIATDGTKLDGIPSDAINGIAFGDDNVNGTSTGFTGVSTLTISTGDGLILTNPSAGEARLEISNNDLVKDTANRTLAATDNASYITNTGAAGTVRWTIPTGLDKFVVTLFKSANQTMEIIGASTVTINGVTETGGAESLVTICPSQYTSFAQIVRTGTNDYTIYTGSVDKVGTPVDNQLSVWTGDGTIEGTSGATYDGTSLTIDGEVVSNWTFNTQTGTTYTLALIDHARIVTMNNGAANVITIPLNASVAYPVGTEIRIIQKGAGVTSVTGATGVTLNGISAGSGAITGQWDEVRLYKEATDTWIVTGDIGAVA